MCLLDMQTLSCFLMLPNYFSLIKQKKEKKNRPLKGFLLCFYVAICNNCWAVHALLKHNLFCLIAILESCVLF